MNDDDLLRSRLTPEPFPLSPPPGLLDELTRRVRRRRARRMSAVLAASVLGVAATFAGGALVADRVLAHRDVVTPATHAPGPTATPAETASAGPTATPLALPTAPPRVRPDDGTDVQDLTWISTETGWALGFVLDCAHVGGDKPVPSCYTVLHTVDGGHTWDKIATLPDPGDAYGGALELRFASKTVGYVIINGRLSLSTDGGRTWVPSALKGVLAVEAARSGAVVLTNASPGEVQCAPCHLLHAPLGSRAWKKTLDLPFGNGRLRRSGDRVLAASLANSAGGANDKSAIVYRSADGGSTWAKAADPCADVHIMGNYVPFATGFELAGKAEVAICLAYAFDMSEHTFVLVSDDGGKTYGDWHDSPCDYRRFALASASTLLCPSQDGIHVSSDGGLTWRLTLPAGATAPADGCGFQTALVGRCVRGVTVYTTRDGGKTWSARDVSAS